MARDAWPTLAFGAMLALLCAWFVVNRSLYPDVPQRMAWTDEVFAGTREAPYQYRVLEHLLGVGFGALLSPVVASERLRYFLGFALVDLVAFAAIFWLLHAWLRARFSRLATLLGMALFAAVVPLTVTGVVEGDYLTVAAYLAAFVLMDRGRDWAVPLVVLVAALGREQAIFVVAFHGLKLLAEERAFAPRGVALGAAGVVAWAVPYFGVRWWFGLKESPYTVAAHVANNTDLGNLVYAIGPLWLALVGGLVVLAALGWRASDRVARWWALALVPYTVLFFFLGNLWELAKYLPAVLVLLPVALRAVAPDPAGRVTSSDA